jgi:energy-coupling factor transport system ATP-binding protein
MNLRFEGVSFSYPTGVHALRDVNLAIGSGEAVAVVGENGAGKTTLAKHMNGLLRPDSGKVWVGDWDTAGRTVAALSRRVGYVFQNPDDQLFERSVRAEVAFGPRNQGLSSKEIDVLVQASLATVGLELEAATHPYDLHVSQRRLVALAATLAMRTPAIILDEPTTGQDAAGVRRLAGIVEALKAEGRTVVTISHDLDFCAEHFERVVVMSGGRILADGPAPEILSQVDLLAQADVEPPQIAQLSRALGLPSKPMSVEEFIELFAAHRGYEV